MTESDDQIAYLKQRIENVRYAIQSHTTELKVLFGLLERVSAEECQKAVDALDAPTAIILDRHQAGRADGDTSR